MRPVTAAMAASPLRGIALSCGGTSRDPPPRFYSVAQLAPRASTPRWAPFALPAIASIRARLVGVLGCAAEKAGARWCRQGRLITREHQSFRKLHFLFLRLPTNIAKTTSAALRKAAPGDLLDELCRGVRSLGDVRPLSSPRSDTGSGALTHSASGMFANTYDPA